jgi:hypothetical protein
MENWFVSLVKSAATLSLRVTMATMQSRSMSVGYVSITIGKCTGDLLGRMLNLLGTKPDGP